MENLQNKFSVIAASAIWADQEVNDKEISIIERYAKKLKLDSTATKLLVKDTIESFKKLKQEAVIELIKQKLPNDLDDETKIIFLQFMIDVIFADRIITEEEIAVVLLFCTLTDIPKETAVLKIIMATQDNKKISVKQSRELTAIETKLRQSTNPIIWFKYMRVFY